MKIKYWLRQLAEHQDAYYAAASSDEKRNQLEELAFCAHNLVEILDHSEVPRFRLRTLRCVRIELAAFRNACFLAGNNPESLTFRILDVSRLLGIFVKLGLIPNYSMT